MNKKIRSMVDEIFVQMKMTAENLALRDELMANAQARYEDAVAHGVEEEVAFAEVAASLEDVCGLLEEMNASEKSDGAEASEEIPMDEADADEVETNETAEEAKNAETNEMNQTDLGEVLGKAFAALGDLGQVIMPEAKKIYGQMDDVTGGVLGKLGRAAQKGMQDAQKAAGEAIDRMSKETGELVFDFGADKEEAQDADIQTQDTTEQAEKLREEAKDLRAQADIKVLVGDGEGAQNLRMQAEQLEVQADIMEQTRQMNDICNEAEQQTDTEPVHPHAEPTSGRKTFPAAGLHRIDVQLDADDVEICMADGPNVDIFWLVQQADGEPAVELEGHVLKVRRKNPDVFKTFFSVFQKDGGKIVIKVPRGYACSYSVTTTSGHVYLHDLDVDGLKVNSTSGTVRVEPDAGIRASDMQVTTVSGHATVSACADTISVTTVSGGQFISCDAHKVDVNSVSGKVHIEGACDEWEVDAVSAEVELLCTVVPTKKIQISSMHGDVHLALPTEIRGFVAEISSVLGGGIINEFGPNRYGTCGLPIRMDTLHGKLLITRL